MKILTIGGTRFIGPPVIRHLVDLGHQVTLFHRGQTAARLSTEVTRILGDRKDLTRYRPDFEKLAPDVVLDLIPYTELDARTAIAAFRGIAKRIVALSSQDVYRAHGIIWKRESGSIDPTPLKESAPLRSKLYPYRDSPMRPMGVPPEYEKILVERTYTNCPDFATTILRLPMVYGPGDPLHRFFAYLQRMDERRPAIVLEAGLANWRSSYGYVENVARAIAIAVNNPIASDRIYNVSEAVSPSEMERISEIGSLVGWSGKVVPIARDRIPATWQFPFNTQQDWVTDSTSIREELGYCEVVSRKAAMKQTIAWERKHPPADVAHSASALALLDYAIEDAILSAD